MRKEAKIGIMAAAALFSILLVPMFAYAQIGPALHLQQHIPGPAGPAMYSFNLTEFDNDFLWTAQNAFYAPAVPFGNWSATPQGCYTYAVANTGICTTPGNSYANLGGSQDLGTITVTPGGLQTSLYGYPNDTVGNHLVFSRTGTTYTLMPTAVSYPVGNFTVSEIWEGYLNFGNMPPSEQNFSSGELYQWVVIKAPSNDCNVLAAYPDAVFVGPSLNAWLIGFNVYDMAHGIISKSYFTMPFPAVNGSLTMFPTPTPPLPAMPPARLMPPGQPNGNMPGSCSQSTTVVSVQ